MARPARVVETAAAVIDHQVQEAQEQLIPVEAAEVKEMTLTQHQVLEDRELLY